MRSATQQSLALEVVKELRCHVTVDEIYHTIVKKHPHISRGTVSWNLNLLSDIGEIRKVEMSGGADRFDHHAMSIITQDVIFKGICPECNR